MCTVMTIDQDHLLGRTMDFPPRTAWHLTYLPRGYQWRAAQGTVSHHNRWALLGGMRVVAGHYLIGDAVNDAGLAGAELFFPVAAQYSTTVRAGTQGMTPQDFIMWALGTHATVHKLAADLDRVTVIDAPWYDDQRYPFHWLLMDRTGTYVIEPLGDHLHVRPNPLGVITNTPALDDQLTHLTAYLNQPVTSSAIQLAQAIATTSQPLPVGGNSVQRFIQAAIWRWRQPPRDANELLAFLQRVTVPHTPAHAHNYTHYQAIINIVDRQYNFYDQHSGAVVSRYLTDLMEKWPTTPQRFES
ncbi:MAG: linear amide C-N hydrolase [Limosilactobacillus pontis]|nr:linear amide C-N hydrolase [Limosilactobacillus pontis]